MLNNLSIKRKLLIYNVLIQAFILIVLSLSIYKTLHLSTLDKIETSLKVIILDIVDDVIDHKDKLSTINFHAESEYKFKPIFIRLIEVENLKVIKSTPFPDSIPFASHTFLKNIIHFDRYKDFILGEIKFLINDKYFILQVATDYKILNHTMEDLFYILLFIVPIVLIFSIIGGYFLIYKSFAPAEKIFQDLKNINATNLSKRLHVGSNDKDEITQLSNEINSLLERLEISFQKINQFSSDASHELKTPLTIIRGELEIALRKDRTQEQYKETLEICMDEVLMIQQTIDDLLFLAKNENDLHTFEEDAYIDEITVDAIKELIPYAKLKNIKMESDIKDIFQIKGHSKLLKIAIKNILKNAITFSHENSTVYIKNYIENNYFIISIKDKGIGIAKEEQKKIFEKFYRTDKSRNKESGGTGLGMSIVEKIVTSHNGKINIESKENIGTCVKLIFMPI